MPIKLLSSAAKRIATLITTSAALLVLLVNAKNLGLDTWFGAHGLNFANAAVRRVVVRPRVDTVYAVGDTMPLAATVTDERGAMVPGASLRWESSDSTVVSVDPDGTVVARGNGTAVITASVRDILATARMTVIQRVTRVAVVGDSGREAYDGDTLTLAAHPVDARDHPVPEFVVGWSTSDSTVVSVDSTGRAVALEPGGATLTAEWEAFSARVAIDVALRPVTLALVRGDGQRAPAGDVLPTPVEVQLLSRDGRPVPRMAVAFRPPRDGRVEPDTAFTDGDGLARATWTLGRRPGRQRLVASVAALDSVLAVTAEADPVRENTRVERVLGDSVARAGAPLAEPVAVRVTDSLGRVLDQLQVRWSAQDGGTVEPLDERTNSLGMAAARWTLGPRAGPQRLEVQVGDPRLLPAVTFAVAAVPGPAHTLAVEAGGDQRGAAGSVLGAPVVVLVRDGLGNPVAGAVITVRPAHGSVADSALVSDSTGRVRVEWTLGGEPGVQLLELRAAGVDSALRVTARGG